MRIIVAHNFYQQPGGEDRVYALESQLLCDRGHEVLNFEMHNDDVGGAGLLMAGRSIWSIEAYRQLSKLCREFNPDVVHFHNTFMRMSPAAYWAARRRGAAVVQTLHNYRLFCPAANCLRDDRVCTECHGKRIAWPGVRFGCYRGSRSATAVVAALNATHRLIGTWNSAIDRYICLTAFAKEQFERAGLPSDRLTVKPNFLIEAGQTGSGSGRYALFVGRLSREKGVIPLLQAWERNDRLPPLKIVGDGDLADRVGEAAEASRRSAHGSPIEWLGRQTPEEVRRLMLDASVLILPSLWFEGLPMTVIEALSCGLPVAASRIGGLPELIHDGETGCLFEPGDPDAIGTAVDALVAKADLSMREACVAAYREGYTAEANYDTIRSVYAAAIEQRSMTR